MTDFFLILISTVLVNNFVLVRFLGLCPFMGVSRNLEAAFGMSVATAFVLTLSSAVSYLMHQYLLLPLDLEYLRTISFILVIAACVQFTEIMVRRQSPLLHQVLGIYIPLIATNCAVLGVALLNVQQAKSFIESVVYGLGASMGFALVLVMFAAIRGRLYAADIPRPFRGSAIAFVTAGIMSLAFLGFSGMARL
jgi:electron transport complex protein RnfA